MSILSGSTPYWAMTSASPVWRGMGNTVSYTLIVETSDEWSRNVALEKPTETNGKFWPIPYLSTDFAHNSTVDPSLCIVTIDGFAEITHCELKAMEKQFDRIKTWMV
jgi:hypothetical protein